EYWVRHLRETVRFGEGLEELMKREDRILLEVGPGSSLSALAKRYMGRERSGSVIATLPTPKDRRPSFLSFYEALGRLWMNGVEMDWASYYAEEYRRRVALPTYPFERQRYWIEPRSETPDANTGLGSPGKKANIADWFYAPIWKRSIRPTQSSPQQRRWLFLMDESGIGSALAERLEHSDCEVIKVVPGSSFSRQGDRQYTIDLGDRDGFSALLAELRSIGRFPERIVHLWSLTPPLRDTNFDWSGRAITPDLERGFYSLLFLTQSLARTGATEAVEIDVIACNLQQVTGQECLAPHRATILAPCIIIPQEHPNITCRSIDIDHQSEDIRQEKLIAHLYAEITCSQRDEIVAYRGSNRWLRMFEPVRLVSQHSEAPLLKQKGCYLITGGLGNIGLTVAEYLARTQQARLVLITRAAFPRRERWDDVLAEMNGSEGFRRKIEVLKSLEEFGAQVEVISSDVSSREQMRAAVASAKELFGELNGVIHVAGTAAEKAFRMIQETGRDECEEQFKTKIYGSICLEEVVRDLKLDFCLLISSLSTVLGGVGLVGYTAAHMFLDAFAQKLSDESRTPWISINCDNWRTRVDDSSIATPFFMTGSEGADAIGMILSGPVMPQVAISTGSLKARLEQRTGQGRPQKAEKAAAPALHQRPDLRSDYVAPRNEAEKVLVGIWQDLLGVEPVGINDNFFDLGGDSIIGIQVTLRANQAGLRLTSKQVFDCQTVAELATLSEAAETVSAEQGIVTGEVRLTPIQRWFFERDPLAPHHFNQSSLFEVRQPLEPDLLAKAFEHLILHHDGLRMRFEKAESGWFQHNAAPDGTNSFSLIDLSAIPQDERSQVIEAAAARLQASLNLSEGPLARIVLFESGELNAARLLIIIHHLVVDAISWRNLLADLQTAYWQLSRGETVKLPSKTTSFKQWAEQLEEYASSEAVRQEAHYWLTGLGQNLPRLPVDEPDGANTVASMRSVKVSLDAGQSRSLYRTHLNDLLMTALAKSLSQWTGSPSVLIDLEWHGREPIFEGIDVSRTTGWFTTLYPVLLEIGTDRSHGDELKAIKEQMRQVPGGGLSYGLLRYMSGEEAIRGEIGSLDSAQVSFLNLGQFDQVLEESSPFRAARESCGPTQSPRAIRSHLLEVVARVVDGCLEVNWSYSENIHHRATIERLAASFLSNLNSLIDYCLSQREAFYTPSDFPDAELTQAELDQLLAELQNL
ncbi:MAG: SDR family NAD(P)-dependent oxidoreductase, partial [Blastocatellia bacterium]|nr:SDR family NAD(P)-dependent oxidoreductase [Blastocatellia bacterium]